MRKIRLVIAVICVAAIATSAWATAAFMDIFNTTYKPKAGSALAKAGCGVCHVGMDLKKLNPYGASLKGKKAEAKSLKAVEKLDSDKDKVSNIAEIKAGTLPGDAKSKPAAKKK